MKRMISGDKAEAALGDEAVQFEISLPTYPDISLPLLGDSFMAHHVLSRETYFDGEELEDLYRSNPTWRYGFWKSFLSVGVGAELFCSLHAWIIPRRFEVRRLLQSLDPNAPDKAMVLSKARLLKLGHLPWTLSNGTSYVRVPYNCLNAAAECWANCLFSIRDVERRLHTQLSAFQSDSSSDLDFMDRGEHRDYVAEQGAQEWRLSDDGSIASVAFSDVRILTFLPPASKVRPDQLRAQLKAADASVALLASACGLDRRNLDWTEIGAELFENLCYDILLQCDRFDPSRMRKLGRTKSRDGGRDIEVWSLARAGTPSQKWIYQCKYSADRRRSLSGSKVSVADVIDQYAADGFGIMTNVVIDATLYDKMDAIHSTRSKRGMALEIDAWSILEIERFLSTKQNLAKRYFKSSTRKLPRVPDRSRS